jgi:hypothetical protein
MFSTRSPPSASSVIEAARAWSRAAWVTRGAQLLGFGAEKHDDAVDALVYLIVGLAERAPQEVHYI